MTCGFCRVIGALAIAMIVGWVPQASAEIYDDFEGACIDPNRWVNLEFVRYIQNGTLKSELTQIGTTHSNTLNFIDPASVSRFQADVTVSEVQNASARPRARVTGFFFNDGTAGSSRAGEVQGEIAIRHNGSGLEVAYFIGRCNDDPCASFSTLHFNNTTFGPVSFNQTYTLSIAFDAAARTFTFWFDGQTTDVLVPVSFAAQVLPSQYTSRTGFRFKGIGTRISGTHPGVFIKSSFDNVQVNGAPYDDFSSDMINRSKWDRLEFVRKVENGVGQLNLTRFGERFGNTFSFVNAADILAYQADLTVTKLVNSGASARARLGGYFYNIGTGGNGRTGEVL